MAEKGARQLVGAYRALPFVTEQTDFYTFTLYDHILVTRDMLKRLEALEND